MVFLYDLTAMAVVFSLMGAADYLLQKRSDRNAQQQAE